MLSRSFPPVVDARSRVLILGSMPGKASLDAQQYYAHPRNLFWEFMERLLGVERSAPYEARTESLLERGVAVWDVLEWCHREGSLDSDIVPDSMVPNDFNTLLEQHPAIRAICFNGAKSAAVFERQVKPRLAPAEGLEFHKLPSTSPANASIPFDAKLEAWRVVASAARTAGRA